MAAGLRAPPPRIAARWRQTGWIRPNICFGINSVAAALGALDERWPGMRDRICDSRPGIRRHIKVFVNGERAGLETPLAAGDEVIVMTAISGG